MDKWITGWLDGESKEFESLGVKELRKSEGRQGPKGPREQSKKQKAEILTDREWTAD